MNEYSVIVEGIGTVHTGTNPVSADAVYGEYKRQVLHQTGRAGDSLCLMKDGEIVRLCTISEGEQEC